mmetsp:Transcript_14754/g.34557  ORF Transcript_14754/g.34557 Transcript_14754/m.34557 type:complete len:859 (-) Transcript_14754:769-3345(-)
MNISPSFHKRERAESPNGLLLLLLGHELLHEIHAVGERGVLLVLALVLVRVLLVVLVVVLGGLLLLALLVGDGLPALLLASLGALLPTDHAALLLSKAAVTAELAAEGTLLVVQVVASLEQELERLLGLGNGRLVLVLAGRAQVLAGAADVVAQSAELLVHSAALGTAGTALSAGVPAGGGASLVAVGVARHPASNAGLAAGSTAGSAVSLAVLAAGGALLLGELLVLLLLIVLGGLDDDVIGLLLEGLLDLSGVLGGGLARLGGGLDTLFVLLVAEGSPQHGLDGADLRAVVAGGELLLEAAVLALGALLARELAGGSAHGAAGGALAAGLTADLAVEGALALALLTVLAAQGAAALAVGAALLAQAAEQEAGGLGVGLDVIQELAQGVLGLGVGGRVGGLGLHGLGGLYGLLDLLGGLLLLLVSLHLNLLLLLLELSLGLGSLGAGSLGLRLLLLGVLAGLLHLGGGLDLLSRGGGSLGGRQLVVDLGEHGGDLGAELLAGAVVLLELLAERLELFLVGRGLLALGLLGHSQLVEVGGAAADALTELARAASELGGSLGEALVLAGDLGNAASDTRGVAVGLGPDALAAELEELLAEVAEHLAVVDRGDAQLLEGGALAGGLVLAELLHLLADLAGRGAAGADGLDDGAAGLGLAVELLVLLGAQAVALVGVLLAGLAESADLLAERALLGADGALLLAQEAHLAGRLAGAVDADALGLLLDELPELTAQALDSDAARALLAAKLAAAVAAAAAHLALGGPDGTEAHLGAQAPGAVEAAAEAAAKTALPAAEALAAGTHSDEAAAEASAHGLALLGHPEAVVLETAEGAADAARAAAVATAAAAGEHLATAGVAAP